MGGVYGDDLVVECKAGYGVQVLQQNSFITQCTVEAVWEPVYQCDGKYDFIVYSRTSVIGTVLGPPWSVPFSEVSLLVKTLD